MKNLMKILPIMVFASILIIACTKDESNQIQKEELIENQSTKTSELNTQELKYSKNYSQIQIAKDKDGNLLVAVPNTNIVYVLQTEMNYNVSSNKIKGTDYQIERFEDKPEILHFKSRNSSYDFALALNDYISDDAFLKGADIFKGYGIIEIFDEKLNKIVLESLSEIGDIDPSSYYACTCVTNGETAICTSGGPKATSCSKSDSLGSCSVTCESGSYACCYLPYSGPNDNIQHQRN